MAATVSAGAAAVIRRASPDRSSRRAGRMPPSLPVLVTIRFLAGWHADLRGTAA
jgi:hypothetical protein